MALAPLHVHSTHSLLEGLPTTAQLVARAVELGYPALALTDTNSMAGCIAFVQECRQAGIRPIVGVELRDGNDPTLRLVLLARNAAGYADLCELTTFHQMQRRGPCLEDLFARAFPDVVALCPHPELLQRLAHTPLRASLSGAIAHHDVRAAERSRAVEAVCRVESLPMAVAHEAWFFDPSEHDLHRVLRAIAHNTDVSRLVPDAVAPRDGWLLAPAQLRERYALQAQALEHTDTLVNSCQDDLAASAWILPHVEVPKGHTTDSWLAKLAHDGLVENYGGKPEWVRAHALQQKELAVIESTGYAGYFLMVREIRRFAGQAFAGGYRRARECSIMRGSAANCLTFYNIGASDLDPVRYNLYFERFLNESRTSPPDADLDFGWDERARALDWFFETYGEDRVCILAATHHFRRKAAFRETAKVLGFSEGQVNAVYERLRREPLRPNTHWLERIEEIDPSLAQVARLAEQVRGRPHFLGQHPGGVLVTDDPIWRHVSCQRSGGATNRVISQIDMHGGIEFLGLVKFDILGNGSLSVLRDALEMLEGQGVPDPRLWDLESVMNDPAVCKMMEAGDTRGVFYLESPAQMRLNRRAQVSTFEEIGITSSLVRPAGTAYAQRFVERHRQAKEGKADWDWIHDSLRGILDESHDVCVFQEDVTRLCVEVAAMSFAEADRVRKMMNSMHEGEPAGYDQTARRFVEGCMSNTSMGRAQAEELWGRVASFRGFSFCKSHSLSYAQLSFRCAWLKKYWPAQFWAAVISNNHGFYTTSTYVYDARRAGLNVTGFDINTSRWKWVGAEGRLRPGLVHVKGFSQATAQALEAEREKVPFSDLCDVVMRCPFVDRQEMENLVRVGAMDGFGPSRNQHMAWLAELRYAGRLDGMQGDLFGSVGLPVHLQTLPRESAAERALEEQKVAGFSTTANVLEVLASLPVSRGTVAASLLGEFQGRAVRVVGATVATRVHRTKHGETMMFVSLADTTGVVDAVLWPEAYRKFRVQATSGGILAVKGKVVEEDGTWTLDASEVVEVRT